MRLYLSNAKKAKTKFLTSKKKKNNVENVHIGSRVNCSVVKRDFMYSETNFGAPPHDQFIRKYMCKRVYLHGPVRVCLIILYAVGFKSRLNKNEQYETINNRGPVVVDVPYSTVIWRIGTRKSTGDTEEQHCCQRWPMASTVMVFGHDHNHGNVRGGLSSAIGYM